MKPLFFSGKYIDIKKAIQTSKKRFLFILPELSHYGLRVIILENKFSRKSQSKETEKGQKILKKRNSVGYLLYNPRIY